MNQAIDSTESIDIRRALDRLQGTLEEFGDKHRELRRDRRQMREYIVELEREAERAKKTADDGTQAERKHADLVERIGQLEQAVRERESLVAEQEDLLQQYQARFDDARDFAAKSDAARRELDAEVSRLRTELAKAGGDRPAGDDVTHVDALATQLSQMRQEIQRIESERAELVANHARITTEFESVRQSEKSALGRVAELEAQLDDAVGSARVQAPRVAELEKRNQVLESELATASTRLRETDSGHAEIERARLLEQELERSRAEVAKLKDRLATARAGVPVGATIDDDEREVMIGQLQSAIGIIDRYLDEA